MSEGSVQDLTELPAELRAIYRTAWEIPMRSLIDMAAERGAFIDQSQSLNLFVENPNIGALSSMYFHAWKKGLKTTYYLRSRPATRITKATVQTGGAAGAANLPAPDAASHSVAAAEKPRVADEAAIACSLENPEHCEACQ
jgi:ribonucleoside-diphosphate reductase alpha chain